MIRAWQPTSALLSACLCLVACPSPSATSATATAAASESETGGGSSTTTMTSTAAESEGESGESESGAPLCDVCAGDEACIDGVCVGVDRDAIERGCHPLSQGTCMYPWPSNFTTYEDLKSPTGVRIDYDAELLPINDMGQRFNAAEIINERTGFSPNSQIRFVTPKGVRSADLAGIDDIASSLENDATIVLMRDDGVRWPSFSEVDARVVGEPERQAVFVRPMRRMDFGARYIVAVRGLRDAAGDPVEPSPVFRALRDGLVTDMPEIEALRPAYEELFAILEAQGIARDELILAWDFTTADEESIKGDARAILPQITKAASGGDLGYKIDSIQELEEGPLGRVIEGVFSTPNCMVGDASPGTVLNRDADGVPVCVGTVEAPFVAAIPRAVLEAGVPAPIAVYGHGLLGDGSEAVSVASKTGNMILVGTDWWGMAEEDIPNVATIVTSSFVNGRSMPERLLQSAVNFTTLGYHLAGELAADPALKAGDAELVDTSVVHYLGGSQGGIMGGTTVAFAPNLNRGVLVVGGANYSLMIWRSTAFGAVDQLWSDYHADDAEREFLFALYQAAFDIADPAIYAEQIRDAPFEGNDQKELLLIEAIGDAQVPNISSEMMARSYGMEMAGPAVYEVYGVPTTTDPIEALAFLQVDTQHPPLPPTENVPAADDNGAHGASADGEGVQATIAAFLLNGVLQNQCEGPCDPS